MPMLCIDIRVYVIFHVDVHVHVHVHVYSCVELQVYVRVNALVARILLPLEPWAKTWEICPSSGVGPPTSEKRSKRDYLKCILA